MTPMMLSAVHQYEITRKTTGIECATGKRIQAGTKKVLRNVFKTEFILIGKFMTVPYWIFHCVEDGLQVQYGYSDRYFSFRQIC